MAAKRAERMQVMLTIDEARQVEAWRLEHHVPSRSAAVRELMTLGLTNLVPGTGAEENQAAKLEGAVPPGDAGVARTDSIVSTGSGGARPAVLVVTGDYLVGQGIGRLLEQAGFRVVGPVRGPEEVRGLAAGSGVAAAVLDVRAAGDVRAEAIGGVADRLARQDIPFVFIADGGREALPGRHRAAPVVSRASAGERLARALARLIA